MRHVIGKYFWISWKNLRWIIDGKNLMNTKFLVKKKIYKPPKKVTYVYDDFEFIDLLNIFNYHKSWEIWD